jgi:hypothetical protein
MIRSRKAEPIVSLKLVVNGPLTCSEAGWDGCPGLRLEDILGLVPASIDQYRCYHAVEQDDRGL